MEVLDTEQQNIELLPSERSIIVGLRLQPETAKGLKGCQEKYKHPNADKLIQDLLAVYVKYREGKLVVKNK